MKIAIIGTGYVGLVTGVCLASKNNEVTCVDLRQEVVDKLNNGIPHIFENGLPELLREVIAQKKFIATSDLQKALDDHELFIIAVGTPSEDGKINLNQIYEVTKHIGLFIKDSSKFISVVVKSTVVPCTTDTFVKEILEKYSGKRFGEFGLGMNPEFLREGEAIQDFMNPDRIVIGSEDAITSERLNDIYQAWDCEKINVNTRTAEMIKYVNNTVLACLISMNNELANLASIMGGIDYMNVVRGVSYDKRWSPYLTNGSRITPGIIEYMKPGVGFGGSCFPKDVQAIRSQGMHLGQPMKLTNAILSVNDNQVDVVLDLLKNKINGFVNKRILILGLAFKPNTDDIRDSSALKIIAFLKSYDCKIIAHDPIAMGHVQKVFPNIQYSVDWRKEVNKADIIIIGTNWEEYLELLHFQNEGTLEDKVVFDSKRLFKKGDFDKEKYFTIG